MQTCLPCSEIASSPVPCGTSEFSERSYLFTISDITHALGLTACRQLRKRFLCERACLRAALRREPPDWWSQTGSNRRPPACKAGALPTELWPLRGQMSEDRCQDGLSVICHLSSVICHPTSVTWMVGLGRLELPTSRLSSARSNQLSYKPLSEDRDQRSEIR